MLAHLGRSKPNYMQVSVNEAKMVFAWSRMRSVRDHSARSLVRYRHLQVHALTSPALTSP